MLSLLYWCKTCDSHRLHDGHGRHATYLSPMEDISSVLRYVGALGLCQALNMMLGRRTSWIPGSKIVVMAARAVNDSFPKYAH